MLTFWLVMHILFICLLGSTSVFETLTSAKFVLLLYLSDLSTGCHLIYLCGFSGRFLNWCFLAFFCTTCCEWCIMFLDQWFIDEWLFITLRNCYCIYIFVCDVILTYWYRVWSSWWTYASTLGNFGSRAAGGTNDEQYCYIICGTHLLLCRVFGFEWKWCRKKHCYSCCFII